MFSNITGLNDNSGGSNINILDGVSENKLLYIKNNNLKPSNIVVENEQNTFCNGNFGCLTFSTNTINTMNPIGLELPRSHFKNDVDIVGKLTSSTLNSEKINAFNITTNEIRSDEIVSPLITAVEISTGSPDTILQLPKSNFSNDITVIGNIETISPRGYIRGNQINCNEINNSGMINSNDIKCNLITSNSITLDKINSIKTDDDPIGKIFVDGKMSLNNNIDAPSMFIKNQAVMNNVLVENNAFVNNSLILQGNSDTFIIAPNIITDTISVRSLQSLLIRSSTIITGNTKIIGDIEFTGNIIGNLPIPPATDFTNISTDVITSGKIQSKVGQLVLDDTPIVNNVYNAPSVSLGNVRIQQYPDKEGLRITKIKSNPNNFSGYTDPGAYLNVDGNIVSQSLFTRGNITGNALSINGGNLLQSNGGIAIGGSSGLTISGTGNINAPLSTIICKTLSIPSLALPAITLGTSTLTGGSVFTGNVISSTASLRVSGLSITGSAPAVVLGGSTLTGANVSTGNYLNLNSNMNTTGIHKLTGNISYADTTVLKNQFQIGLINNIPGIVWVDNNGIKHSMQFWNNAIPSQVRNQTITNNPIYYNV